MMGFYDVSGQQMFVMEDVTSFLTDALGDVESGAAEHLHAVLLALVGKDTADFRTLQNSVASAVNVLVNIDKVNSPRGDDRDSHEHDAKLPLDGSLAECLHELSTALQKHHV